MFPYIHIVLPTYGVMAFIGLFTAMLFLYFRKDRYGIEFGDFIKIFISGVIGLLIGSKVLYAVTQIPWLIHNFTVMNLLMLIPQSGYVFYGGLLGTIAGVYIFIRITNCGESQKVYNMITPAIPLFHFFGRIGCYLSGCCYGKPLQSHFDFLGIIRFNRIPTQLFEALFELMMFILCLIAGRKTNVYLLKLYLVCYSIFRFFIEFFRGDDERGFLFVFSTSQWVSAIILISIITSKVRQKRKGFPLTGSAAARSMSAK